MVVMLVRFKILDFYVACQLKISLISKPQKVGKVEKRPHRQIKNHWQPAVAIARKHADVPPPHPWTCQGSGSPNFETGPSFHAPMPLPQPLAKPCLQPGHVKWKESMRMIWTCDIWEVKSRLLISYKPKTAKSPIHALPFTRSQSTQRYDS